MLVGCVVNADWTGNAAAAVGLYVDANKQNAHTKAGLILSLFIYPPVLAEMTQNLLQRADRNRVTSSVGEVTPTSLCTKSTGSERPWHKYFS